MGVEFRRATEEESERRRALVAGQGWESENVDLGEPWVAVGGGDVVGTLRVLDAGEGASYLADVIVREDLRGAGIGADMVCAAVRSRERDAFYLVCHDERVAFYGRLGFSEIPKVELPEGVMRAADQEGDLETDHEQLHHFMFIAGTAPD